MEKYSFIKLSNRNCLALTTNAASFAAWNDNKPIFISKEFSIVAWVKIPTQQNNFLIVVDVYNGPSTDVFRVEGGVYLAIDADDTLRGGYDFNGYTT